MSADATVQDHANRLASLIEERLGVRGSGLEAKLRRAGRALPRYVRREAGQIVQAAQLTAHPKMARQVDATGVEKAFRRCEAWLKSVDPKERRKDAVLRFLGVNALNLMIVGGAFITWLVWSGNL